MKKISGSLSAAVFAAVAVLPAPAHAAGQDGAMITLQGSVTGSGTCGFDTRTISVPLPVVEAAALSSAGATAGDTDAFISYSCPVPMDGRMNMFFDNGDSNVNSVTGNLKNDGTAGQVEIQLLGRSGVGGDYSPINLGISRPGQANGSSSVRDYIERSSSLFNGHTTPEVSAPGYVSDGPNPKSITFKFGARYYAADTVSPGTVQSSITFSVEYL
jgi:major type 1 subunit fimbrin (pilin)